MMMSTHLTRPWRGVRSRAHQGADDQGDGDHCSARDHGGRSAHSRHVRAHERWHDQSASTPRRPFAAGSSA